MRKTIVSLATLAATMMLAGGAFAAPLDGVSWKQINKALQSQPAPSKPPVALGRVVTQKDTVALGKVKTGKPGPLATDAVKECAACKYIPAGGAPTAPPSIPGPAKPPGGGSAGTTPPPATGGGMPPGGIPGGGMGGKPGGTSHTHGPYFYPGIGFGLAAVGVAAAAPTVVEYVQQPVYPQVAEAQPAYAQPVYAQPVPNYGQAAPVAVVANPFDSFVERLNGLSLAMQQGLITKDEYRAQRQAVMASLDAGQVSRSVGVQQGLRQLRMMADGGALTAREYDDKRKEFVLFL